MGAPEEAGRGRSEWNRLMSSMIPDSREVRPCVRQKASKPSRSFVKAGGAAKASAKGRLNQIIGYSYDFVDAEASEGARPSGKRKKKEKKQ